MKVTAHCFAPNAKVSTPILFKFKDVDVSVRNDKHKDDERLLLEITKTVDPAELAPPPKDQQDKDGKFIEARMRPYKELLTEAVQLVEGYLSILYFAVPPRFDPNKIIVNVIAENAEEEAKIESGEVSGGFGNIEQPVPKVAYQWDNKVLSTVDEASKHLPAFSFLAQAIRAQARGDQEVAFFLYFRIIDGYFADGAKDVEKAMLQKTAELAKYFNYDDEIKKATQAILSALQLPSKSAVDFAGLISDFVLIRHRLTHFSATNAERHSRTSIKFDLNLVNFRFHRACVLLLRDKVGV